MSSNSGIRKWIDSADAWITDQKADGDWSRRAVLDPALEAIFSNVEGTAILDLGCGEGRYSRKLKDKGAVVSGIDPVPRFIERARSLDTESKYVEGTAEALPFADGSFDLVLSYLSFIDIADLEAAATETTRVLRPGGKLIIVTISNIASPTAGWIKDEHGNKLHRIVDRYMEEFEIEVEWKGVKISNYHRPLSYILGLFLSNGYVLTQFIEPLPETSDPRFADEYRVPNFQILCLERSAVTQRIME